MRVLLLGLLALPRHADGAYCRETADGLLQWLCESTFHIPDIDVVTNTSSVHLHGTACTGLQLAELSPSLHPVQPLLTLAISGAAVDCTVESLVASGFDLGASVSLADVDVAISVELLVDPATGLPSGLNVTECMLNIPYSGIYVSIDTGLWFFNSVANVMVGIVVGSFAESLGPLIEEALRTAVNERGSEALRRFSAWLEPLREPQPPLPEPPMGEAAVRWNAPPLSGVLSLVPSPVLAFVASHSSHLLTDAHGRVLLPLPPVRVEVPPSADIDIEIAEVNITGLADFEQLELLHPLDGAEDAHSLRFGLEHAGVQVTARVALTVTPLEKGMLEAAVLREHFVVSLDLRRLEVELLAMLALNASSLQQLRLEQLAEVECALQPLLGAMVRTLGVQLEPRQIQLAGQIGVGGAGALELQLDELINSALLLITRTFDEVLPSVIRAMAAVPARDAINTVLSKAVAATAQPRPTCDVREVPAAIATAASAESTASESAASGTSAAWAVSVAEESSGEPVTMQATEEWGSPPWCDDPGVQWVHAHATAPALNALMRRLELSTLELRGRMLDIRLHDDTMGDIQVALDDLTIDGLDTWTQLELLRSRCDQPTLLESSLGYAGKGGMTIDGVLRVNIAGEWTSFYLRVNLRSHLLRLGALVDLSLSEVLTLTVQQALSSCVALPLHSLVVTNETALILIDALDSRLDIELRAEGHPNHAKIPTDLIFFLMNTFASDFLTLTNALLHDGLALLHHTCTTGGEPSPPEASLDPHRYSLLVLCLMYGTVLAVLCGFVAVHFFFYYQSDAGSLLDYGVPLGFQCPPWLSTFVTVMLVCNMLLFLAANFSNGASVIVSVQVAGEELHSLTVFNFTLSGSIIDMWVSGGQWLSILVAVFSGVWPYVKLGLTLIALWSPPALLPIERREYVLRVMDALGKWSLVDVIMIIMTMVAFDMHFVEVPGTPPRESLADVRVEVMPDFGALGFAAAVVLSIGLTQAVVRMQRALHLSTLEDAERATLRRETHIGGSSTRNGGSTSGSGRRRCSSAPAMCTDQGCGGCSCRSCVDTGGSSGSGGSGGSALGCSGGSRVGTGGGGYSGESALNERGCGSSGTGDDGRSSALSTRGGGSRLDEVVVGGGDDEDGDREGGVGGGGDGGGRGSGGGVGGGAPLTKPPMLKKPSGAKIPVRTRLSVTTGQPSRRATDVYQLQSHTFLELLGQQNVKMPKWAQRVVIGSLISSICVHGTALVLDLFTIHIQGLTGLMLGSKAHVSYSVLSLGVMIPSASPSTNHYVMIILQVFYLMICALVPILWLFACIFIWMTPLQASSHRRLGLLCESAHAWAAIDVLLVVNVASLLQLDGLAQTTIGSKCDLINQLLAKYFTDIVPEPKCFGLQPTFDPGYWLMTASTVLGTIAGGFVMHCSHSALDDERLPPWTDRLTATRRAPRFQSSRMPFKVRFPWEAPPPHAEGGTLATKRLVVEHGGPRTETAML